MLPAHAAVTTTTMSATHSTMVRVSRSRKNMPMRPFHTSAWMTKLMEPNIMSTMSTNSSVEEW